MKVSAKRIIAIILFVAFFLFVATWYYRMILLLLAVTVFWRKSIRQWMTSHNHPRLYAIVVAILVVEVLLFMPKPYSFGRVKLYYQDEQGKRTHAPLLQCVCNALLPEEEIMNVGMHATLLGKYVGYSSKLYGESYSEYYAPKGMGQQCIDAAVRHGHIFEFYAPYSALERNFNTPMSGTYAQAFYQKGIQKSHSVYVIRPKHYDSSKTYPLVVFCHGDLGNWQLYNGIWRDLENCIVLSIGTDDWSGKFHKKEIDGIFTRQIPFLQSLGYKIDMDQLHLIGLSNGGSACRIAYERHGNKFKSISGISAVPSPNPDAGKRKCMVNLLGGNDCSIYPQYEKQYKAMGMDAACYYEPKDNHFFAVNHRKEMIAFLNKRMNNTVK